MSRYVSSSGDVTIRSATNRDRERVEALVVNILLEFGLQPDFESSEADLKDIEATYDGGMFALVEDNVGNLVGTVAVLRVDDEICKLRKMYLIPPLRGIGVGRLMLEHAIGVARDLGFKTMTLETVSVLQDAIRLYRRAGFKLVTQGAMSPRCDQVYLLSLAGTVK
ncbi:MAG: GNAT family N-acetyltransferase [Chloroflexota bacterium]|nr:GNAT family N-acetyltransferase [Chloroflexota bacterium]